MNNEKLSLVFLLLFLQFLVLLILEFELYQQRQDIVELRRAVGLLIEGGSHDTK